MSFSNSDLESTDFSGIVRLFPLPNLVLYPGVVQPLHIFEPRYRQMMRHALAGDNLLAVALYKPNWESASAVVPPVHEVICVGKIMAHVELEDGRFNLMLKGLKRARIFREIPTEASYRMADVDLIEEPVITPEHLVSLRSNLIAKYTRLMQSGENDFESATQLVEQDLPLGTLVDLIAFSSELLPLQQQTILNTIDIHRRGELLLEMMEQKMAETKMASHHFTAEFPPEFSYN